MGTASVNEPGWLVSENGRALCLVVHLRQRSYLFPWSLFLFAEGNDGAVQVTFHTHVLQVEGAGLSALLVDFAAQVVTELLEPDRTAKFSPSPGPQITAVSVSENK